MRRPACAGDPIRQRIVAGCVPQHLQLVDRRVPIEEPKLLGRVAGERRRLIGVVSNDTLERQRPRKIRTLALSAALFALASGGAFAQTAGPRPAKATCPSHRVAVRRRLKKLRRRRIRVRHRRAPVPSRKNDRFLLALANARH
jgi:hypothetical protein